MQPLNHWVAHHGCWHLSDIFPAMVIILKCGFECLPGLCPLCPLWLKSVSAVFVSIYFVGLSCCTPLNMSLHDSAGADVEWAVMRCLVSWRHTSALPRRRVGGRLEKGQRGQSHEIMFQRSASVCWAEYKVIISDTNNRRIQLELTHVVIGDIYLLLILLTTTPSALQQTQSVCEGWMKVGIVSVLLCLLAMKINIYYR